MARAVFAIGLLGLLVLSAMQAGLVDPVNAAGQKPAAFRTAQAAAAKPAVEGESVLPKSSGAVMHGSAANGGDCIRPTKEMRKNHMDLILHKRDRTMYDGIRTKDASLKQCISCHAVKGEDGDFVKASNPKHFCRGCHDYTAVKIDCFECHASRPEVKRDSARLNPHKKHGSLALVKENRATSTALNAYLGGVVNDK